VKKSYLINVQIDMEKKMVENMDQMENKMDGNRDQMGKKMDKKMEEFQNSMLTILLCTLDERFH
jgi:hypothetical protein